jgi:rhodanese-related sulfurtransferase
MKRKLLSTAVLWLFIAAANLSQADDVIVTKEFLQKRLGETDMVVVDVRTGKDWGASEHKIKNAVRVPLNDVGALTKKHSKDKTIVFYCA